mmetsp:Transcript_27104/g.64392  ORF Transcript_27104/g.64392 Transcript_27104/m.64392 type:complete len:207 (-) Transcript_27104:134-754(-)
MYSVKSLEFRRFKTIFIQRANQIIAAIMLSIKSHSVVSKNFSCFTLNPKNWRKKITAIFYLGGRFHIIFWKKNKRKFSGFIKQPTEKIKKKFSRNNSLLLLKDLTPLCMEADLTILDGFIQFRNKSIKILPIQIAPENLWASFPVVSDFSNQIEKHLKFISKNLKRSLLLNCKITGEGDYSLENQNSFFKDLYKEIFLDLIFRRRI